ncbi:hypothetical protein RRG08_007372 [Elysia crispata]|uniref:Uncharacterized protein n=1 Tax=Elysia crispata TaxID=231223 RepID=A0AAE1AQV5_9GAST|nr:hypothetical protein RRG08_007372 [Elysia crispata]
MRPSNRKALILTGAVLNTLPISLSSYYGNLLPYIDSYYHANRGTIGLHVDPLWIVSVFEVTLVLGMIFTSPLEHRIGIHLTIFAGDVFISFSVISGYLTIKEPLALTFIFGGLQGTSVGIVFALVVKLLLQTIPNNGGLATGVMSAGPVLGALVFIGVAFAVINPSNKEPNLTVHNKVYFADEDLIDRVPIYFLVVGAITTASTLIGAALMYFGSWKLLQNSSEEKSKGALNISIQKNTQTARSEGSVAHENSRALSRTVSTTRNYSTHAREEIMTEKNTSFTSTSRAKPEEIGRNAFQQDNQNSIELCTQDEISPRDAIKTTKFWLVWLAYVTSNHTNYLHLNLYKQYGQQAISDDSLLVTIGIISNAGMVVIRPLVGVASDRFGIRNTSIILNSASCLFMSLMVLALHICPWAYMVLIVIEYIGVSPHTMIFSLLTAFEFDLFLSIAFANVTDLWENTLKNFVSSYFDPTCSMLNKSCNADPVGLDGNYRVDK